MNIELYLLANLMPHFIPQAQVAFQIQSQWAFAIGLGLLLAGALVGLLISWLVTGRDMKRTRSEAEQLRSARDMAQAARAQALNERERAMRELHGKQQEFALMETQYRSTQKQLDQAQAALRVSEQQAEEVGASARALRMQVDELRKQVADCEHASVERQMALSQLTSEVNEAKAHYNEAQRLATERQATLVSTNAQLSEYRARIAEADISTAEMQATLLSLGSQLEAHRLRLAEIERRAQAPREALAPSAASPAQPTNHNTTHLSAAPHGNGVVPNTAIVAVPTAVPTPGVNGASVNGGQPQPEVDESLPLESIKGIGAGYAARLREAGIETVRDLAHSTPDQLDAIVKAPKWRQPDYAGWIRYARLLARAKE
jgi:predicted flap endonuclease-1-like 5' DNA nuclease